MNRMIYLSLILLSGVYSTALSGDWPHWRGPQFNGSSDEVNLPSQWDASGKNIRWAVDLPGPSAATPIVVGDRVFLSSTEIDTKQLIALCYNRTDGKLLWRHDVTTGTEIRRDSRSTFAAPSPVADGQRVVFFYSTGDLLCCGHDGKLIWKRNIQKDYGTFAFLWTFSSTPLLYDGKLYLQVLQRDVAISGRGFADRENRSYLLAMDPATGKTLWRQFRPSKAVAESHESFASPVPYTYQQRAEILVAGGDAITGHDPQTGKELWRWGTYNPTRITSWRFVPSPVAGGGIILVCAPKRSPIYAIRAGATGTPGDEVLAWVSKTQRELSSDVPTPAFYDGDFFVLSDVRRSLSRIDPQSGTIKWTVETPGRDKYEASPTVADGKIYLISFAGLVVVVDAKTGKIVSKIPMAERQESPVRSTVSVAHGNLFIRTNDKLFCVGK